MDNNRFEDLSPRQRECLRLVARGMNTKEIAAQLAISPETARSHIDAARARVGVDRRSTAARLLAEYESDAPPHRTGSPPEGMAGASTDGQPCVVSSVETRSFPVLHDAARPTYSPTSKEAGSFRWPFRTEGRPFNDLAWWEQVAWAVAIAVGSIVAVHEVAAFLRG